jgi:hypothetical protein
MGPITKGPSGCNLSSEEKERLLRQLQESKGQGSSSSPIGMSGRSLSSFDVGKSFPIGMGGASYGTGVPTYSRSRSWGWLIAGIVIAVVVIAGIWLLVRRFV